MRVLFWSESFWPHLGGAEVRAVGLLATLRQRGYTLDAHDELFQRLVRERVS